MFLRCCSRRCLCGIALVQQASDQFLAVERISLSSKNKSLYSVWRNNDRFVSRYAARKCMEGLRREWFQGLPQGPHQIPTWWRSFPCSPHKKSLSFMKCWSDLDLWNAQTPCLFPRKWAGRKTFCEEDAVEVEGRSYRVWNLVGPYCWSNKQQWLLSWRQSGQYQSQGHKTTFWTAKLISLCYSQNGDSLNEHSSHHTERPNRILFSRTIVRTFELGKQWWPLTTFP